jgi:NADH-quinone oxidoreductase subunit A
MWNDYLSISALVVIASGLAGLVLVLSRLLGPQNPSAQKRAPYESGMMPFGPALRRLPIGFYLTATLFIVFDIEIIFLYPWAVVFRRLGWFGIIEISVFLLVLTVGFLYIWRKGALRWD